MRIFVTGGTGFIGSHFLNLALTQGHEIIALRRPGSSSQIPVKGPIEWIDVEFGAFDFSNYDTTGACLVHLAAYGVSPQPCEWNQAFQVNVLDSISLMTKAAKAGIMRWVNCGSCLEYGKSGERYEKIPTEAPLEPVGSYASSKAAQSIALSSLARELKLEFIGLRPFHVFGEGQHISNFWPSLRAAAITGADFPMTVGTQIRDFIYVTDVAKAFLAAATRDDLIQGLPTFQNIGTGSPISLADFAKREWSNFSATGHLKIGALPMRNNEIMSFIPKLNQL